MVPRLSGWWSICNQIRNTFAAAAFNVGFGDVDITDLFAALDVIEDNDALII